MADFNVGDLQFILQQIKISEALANHTLLDGTPFTGTQEELTAILIPNPLLPWGLRTVDGSGNNISLPGVRDNWGAADQLFPRLLEQDLNAASPRTFDPDGPAGPEAIGQPTSYTQASGSVFDPQIRLASNAVVDQTLNNPAAIYAALAHEGITGEAADDAVAEIQAAYQNSLNPGGPDPIAVANAQAALNAAQANLALATTVNAAYTTTLAAYSLAANTETNDARTAALNAFNAVNGLAAILPVNTNFSNGDQTQVNAAIALATTARTEAQQLLNVLNPLGPDLVTSADLTAAQNLFNAANQLVTDLNVLLTNLQPVNSNINNADIGRLSTAIASANTANNTAISTDIQIDASNASGSPVQSAAAAAAANVTSAQAAVTAAQAALQDALNGTGPDLGDVLEKYNLSVINHGTATTKDDSLVIDNIAPDEGISAPFNGWMTLFGQFFDHGLDLVTKGGNGTVFVPLSPDDPLFDHTPGARTNFMALTRATQVVREAGADGAMNTADDTFRARIKNADGSSPDATFETINTTTPFVDQNQTYTSHASHQVFLREYVDADPGAGVNIVATGRFLNGTAGGLATWADVKAQAADLLGIQLVDADIGNVPLLATDEYGRFLRGPNGFAQVVIRNGTTDILVEGDPTANGGLGLTLAQMAASVSATATVMRTGHAFLDDIAHTANPFFSNGQARTADGTTNGRIDGIGDHLVQTGDREPVRNADGSIRDADNDPGNGVQPILVEFSMANREGPTRGGSSFYDNELLDAHFITGDGRGNENIGLTAVHDVFHSEHNRLAEQTKTVVLASRDAAFINEWLNGVTVTQAQANGNLTTLLNNLNAVNAWNGERLFQAARFGTEMQYQHMVFEEFARKVNPAVDLFVFNPTEDINPAIFAEFAHVVYRFGHSMLTETIDRFANGTQETDDASMQLFDAFLNPLAFNNSAELLFNVDNTAVANNAQDLSAEEASGYIIRGMTAQVGQAIDEFVVEALRNNLVGLPLDLPTLNMARARDTGVPGLNDTRSQLFEMTKSEWLKPYVSWTDFAQSLKNPASIVNFIAAYGTHTSITSQTTLADKRLAALELVLGVDQNGDTNVAADRLDFLNGSGAYGKAAGLGGLDKVDLWLGGLAEAILPFGGMLGSTFTAIFEKQLQNLQNGDRFYYLSRTQGLHFVTELENNSFAAIIKNNTTIGDTINTDTSRLPVGAETSVEGSEIDATQSGHIPGEAFARVEQVLEVNLNFQRNPDPTEEDRFLAELQPKVVRVNDNDNIAGNNINPTNQPDAIKVIDTAKLVLDGTISAAQAIQINTLLNTNNTYDNLLKFRGGEHVVLGGTNERDVLIADLGDDTIWGDGGNDLIIGDHGINRLHGGDGDDIIYGGGDAEFIHGEAGNDVIHAGNGLGDLVFGGSGHDFIISGEDATEVFAAEGNDFILGTADTDFLLGGEGDDWIEGGEGFDTIAGENSELFFNSSIVGHDVMFAGTNEMDFDSESGDDIMVQGESVMRNEGMLGFDWVTFKGVQTEVNADMRVKIFTTVEADILRNRFDQVEAMSGWKNADILIGDDRIAPVEDPTEPGLVTAENTLLGSALDRAGVERISGFQNVLGLSNAQLQGLAQTTVAFDDGNILLGGDRSDTIQGGAGDDIIDGDKWLNVRIGIYNANGQEIGTADTMQGVVNFYTAAEATAQTNAEAARGDLNANRTVYAAANATLQALDGQQLDTLVFSRAINPGDLRIVREINDSSLENGNSTVNGFAGDIDTAVFQGAKSEYTARVGGPTGALIDLTSTTLNLPLGTRVWIEHTLGDPRGGGLAHDGTDTLINIERLQFSDGTVMLRQGLNAGPAGNPEISTLVDPDGNAIVQAGLPIMIRTNANGSLFGVTDSDNVSATNPTGQIFNFSVSWQIEGTPGAGDFADSGFTGLAFIPPAALELNGEAIRAVVSYDDGDGIREFVISAATGPIDPATGTSDILDAADAVIGQQLVGTHAVPNHAANIAFRAAVVAATGLTTNAQLGFALPQSGVDGSNNNANSPFGATGNGEDEVYGLSGNDVLDGGENDDLIFGGAGDDLLYGDNDGGGPNSDGDGNDILDGGAGIDTARFDGAIGNYVISLTPDPAFIEVVHTGGTEDGINVNIEQLQFTANGGVTLNTADVLATLNALAADPATDPGGINVVQTIVNGANRTFNGTGADEVIAGLNNAAGVDTINAGGGIDLVFGLAGNDVLNGGAGDDEIRGGLGNDTIRGDAGNDLIIWSANNGVATDGRDLVNGDTGNANSGADVDTFQIDGVANLAETYRVYTRTAWLNVQGGANTAAQLLGGINTEIVVTRNGTNAASIIAELDNIEELVINGIVTPAGNNNLGGDTVQVIGDFTNTSLALATITINGTDGDDEVDISMLTSAHRIVFRSNGGDDTVIGTIRAQDVIELAPGLTPDDYDAPEYNGNGTWTITQKGGGHSITYTGGRNMAQPTFVAGGTVPDTGNGDDQGEDDDNDNGSDDDSGSGDDNDNGSGDDNDSGDDDDDDDDSDGATPPGPITSQHVVFAGTGGNDTGFGGAGNDTMSGGDGNDTLFSYGGDDSVVGGDGNDELFTDAGKDVVSGGDGADRIFAGDGDDIILAGAGNDTVDAGAGNDKIWGDAGRDVINGGLGNDVIFASAGDGNDAIHGDEGIDTVNYEAISSGLTIDLDNLMATSTESGADTLSGIENVIGGAGNDTIIADNAVNVLNGGGGNDTFVFKSAAAANGDKIEGFQAGDKIDLSALFGTAPVVHGGTFTANGQIKLTVVDGDTIIEGNTDNDAGAEFSITVSDFVIDPTRDLK